MCKAPRVLIYGQPFNALSGGGITLTNLFKGWPKDKLAVTFVAWNDTIVDTSVCTNYYLIGKSEHKWRFPLNFFKKPFPTSGVIPKKEQSNVVNQIRKITFRNSLSDLINPILHWLGVYHIASKITLSEIQRIWIKDFSPEVLYLQVSTLEGMAFANQLIDYLKIPSAIHMMDDWPSTISEHGLFKNYWKNKIDTEFRQLLNKIDIHLSISDAMSEEYFKRYQKHFTAFHNPVEITPYSSSGEKGDLTNNFRILYLGRIGTANKESIILFAKVISQLKIDNLRVELEIYSKDEDIPDLKPITNLDNVKISPPVPYESVPGMLKDYNLLFLPLDFTAIGLKFAKFSIPTKATEYMLSGTPVFVLAPEETAVSKFFKKNDCGYCVTNPNEEEIIKGIRFLINDQEYRKRISHNAMNLAKEKFDAVTVRQKFQNMLAELSEKKTYI